LCDRFSSSGERSSMAATTQLSAVHDRRTCVNFADALEAPQVTLRRFPYPYRCALAICSDLDETPDGRAYDHLLRFLNTEEATDFGPGVGLECANSIYFDMPPAQFSYWNGDPKGQEMVRTYIRSGHVDVLHSFGDLAGTRAAANRALEELHRHDCRLAVWVDHSKAPTNFGGDIMSGLGDVVGSLAYHADLTAAYGIRYAWRGRVTSVIGQDEPHTTRAVGVRSRPLRSFRTVLKEHAKHQFGRAGSRKYAMHAANVLRRPVRLRDDTPVVEFMRFNPHWAGVSHADSARALSESLSPRVLDCLLARESVSILYAHLGKFFVRGNSALPEAITALRALRDRYEQRTTLLTTTARLLRHVDARDGVRFTVTQSGERTAIRILEMQDALARSRAPCVEELAGLTFVAPGRRDMELELSDSTPVRCELYHANDQTYAMIPWRRLPFPQTS